MKKFLREYPAVLIAGLPLLLFLLFLIANKLFPLPEPYGDKDFARVVLDSEGRPLRFFADRRGEWRYQVTLSQVSPKYLEALIGYEDRYFYTHPGINPAALMRSAFQLAANRKIISGGSTITMQVARIIDPHSRTVGGKLKQMFRALQLELHYSKEEILEMYLNLAPFGGSIQGVQAAAYTYFDRDASELTYTEAALLAILPQAPSRLRPDRNPTAATAAKNKVTERLRRYGYWDEDIVRDVLSEPVVIFITNRPASAPLLAEKLIRIHPDSPVIQTYINRDLQDYLEALLLRQKYTLPPGSSAAVVVIENENSKVRGYAGSMEYGNTESFGYIDMADAVRSPGSALKPFIYAMGLDKQLIHSQSLLIDAPRIYSSYQAGNFYQNFSGAVSAESALQRSLNVPAVQVLEHVTPLYFYSSIINTGVRFPVLGGRPNLSIALGGGGMRLSDLGMLYTSLANGGLVTPLKFTTLDADLPARPLISEEAAYIVYEMLRKQFRPDHIFHEQFTGRKNLLAWKTGTSYGFRDAITVGVTKEYTIAVWVGMPDNTPSPGQYGAVTAAPLLFEVSDWLERNSSQRLEILRPPGVKDVRICWPSGLPESMTRPQDCHMAFTAMTINGAAPATLPETSTDINQSYRVDWLENSAGERTDLSCSPGEAITAKNAAVWPRLVEPWILPKYRRAAIVPKWAPSCDRGGILSGGDILITGVVDRSTLRSGTLEAALPEITLSAAGASGTVRWYLNGEQVAAVPAGTAGAYRMQSSGTFQLVAIDDALHMAVITFYVD